MITKVSFMFYIIRYLVTKQKLIIKNNCVIKSSKVSVKFACFTKEWNDINFSLVTNIVASTKTEKSTPYRDIFRTKSNIYDEPFL